MTNVQGDNNAPAQQQQTLRRRDESALDVKKFSLLPGGLRQLRLPLPQEAACFLSLR